MTLRDVARHCNVSISTVSRVLNGTSTVKPEIAERVRKAAAELRHTPNMADRQLRLHVDPEFGPDFSTRQADHSLEKRAISS
ncbi:LacI family DNA-binding transcriptional regulator [Sulfobacillus harzensis]|uniref:LacI family transcriptional regulator n=1 Tax=Sulfobacillus harzensis TaxID=2729629 RepID=A0A7Y0L7U4_9FIRM|nr:LacI family DNA-binding transcriptional regulator [Sulfobacillus harzensis]NMP24914.1 LacI family transcriptional regulator [Sulfobacillus harzensis]